MKKKVGKKWQVRSHRTGKKLGTYNTEAQADAAIRRHKHYGRKKNRTRKKRSR